MNHEESFKAWLPGNELNDDSIKSYISYLASVEKVIGSSIDDLLKTDLEKVIEMINSKKFVGKSEKTLDNYKAAIKKYWSFLHSK